MNILGKRKYISSLRPETINAYMYFKDIEWRMSAQNWLNHKKNILKANSIFKLYTFKLKKCVSK